MPNASSWTPPSSALVFDDGIWRAMRSSPISYPASGNDDYLQIEDRSYWFAHRVACLRAVIESTRPPPGMFLDVGGGNGHVAAALAQDGHDVVLIEPGVGAANARRRGLKKIIQATLQDAELRAGSFAAAGTFDVIEHIEDDVAFLHSIHRLLHPRGVLYGTVPAHPSLWSVEDDTAGHFRRYRASTLRTALERAGFAVDFISPFFSWLIAPIALLRALTYRLQKRRTARAPSSRTLDSDHTLPAILSAPVRSIHAWEIQRLRSRRPLPFGASLLWAAHRPR
jgi:2-polyprenyl-3-methyl-5-hydroxy-6-metoxy-1,4-benzoquinol methylase